MPITKMTKGFPTEYLAAKGFVEHDMEALTPCQRECISRVCHTVQLEDEAYLSQHPEITALLERFISEQCTKHKYRTNFLKEAADFFTRPKEVLDEEARKRLGIGPDEPYVSSKKPCYHIDDENNMLMDIFKLARPPSPTWSFKTTPAPTPETLSSSFLSMITSDTTLPTPEPEPPKQLTDSEHFFNVVSATIDKAIYMKIDEKAILYDIAYVRIADAVEEAMEVPVAEIKEDIIDLFYNAYTGFNTIIIRQEILAAETAWNKRMRKKIKRTLRRQANFKGYESPVSSERSSRTSDYLKPLLPCKCHPQSNYNRYPKDRFGIYLPNKEEYINGNTTMTPIITPSSSEEEVGEENDLGSGLSMTSKTSKVSKVSKVSKASKVSRVSKTTTK